MLLKDKETGEVVGMRYDIAVSAVRAGTHAFVETSPPRKDDASGASDADDASLSGDGGEADPLAEMTKVELLAEAERLGVDEAKRDMKKEDILSLIRAKAEG